MSNDIPAEDRALLGLRPPPPSGVGTKFYPDGRVRPFAGNTIICHIPPGAARDGLLDLHGQLQRLGLGPSVTFLPPDSLHMTVFEGVCDQVRKPGHWPADLATDAPLDSCHGLFAEKLHRFDLACDPPFRLSVDSPERLVTGIGLRLLAADQDERRLRDLRNRLAALLQLYRADHASYIFHVSFAYIIRELTPQQTDMVLETVAAWQTGQPGLELGAPEFCIFENMFSFDRQFYLRRRTAIEDE